ncbi:MAG: hypothetical protein ACLTC3_07595 [Evtepia gabavorous]
MTNSCLLPVFWGRDRGKLHPTLAGLLLLGKRKALRAVFPAFRLEYRETDTGFCLSTLRPGPPENVFSFYTMVSRRLTAVSSLLAQDPGEGRPWPAPCGRPFSMPFSTPITSAGAA